MGVWSTQTASSISDDASSAQQRRFAGSRDTRDGGEHPGRDVDVDVRQVVLTRAADFKPPGRRARIVLEHDAELQAFARARAGVAQLIDAPLEDHLSPVRAGAGAELHDVVGGLDRLRAVLDDEHGVALVAQSFEQAVEPVDVRGVQPGGRLVEDIRDVAERGAEVADHLHALRLAAGQRRGRPVQREVAETDRGEIRQRIAYRRHQRPHPRCLHRVEPLGEVGDLHRAQLSDILSVDCGVQRMLGETDRRRRDSQSASRRGPRIRGRLSGGLPSPCSEATPPGAGSSPGRSC